MQTHAEFGRPAVLPTEPFNRIAIDGEPVGIALPRQDGIAFLTSNPRLQLLHGRHFASAEQAAIAATRLIRAAA